MDPSSAYLVASVLTPVLYALLCGTFYYLASRAKITEFLWSRYPPWLDHYTLCAACLGFALGIGCAFFIGWARDLPFLLLPGRFWATPLIVGLCSIVWTPLVAAKHLQALEYTGAAEGEDDGSTPEEP